MLNNDIFKRLKTIFDMDDRKMKDIFLSEEYRVPSEKLRRWKLKEGDPDYVSMKDRELAIFLNGFISERRGKKEGAQMTPENRLNNNLILKKLKIALALKSEDILELFALIEKPITAHELSGFLRNPKQEKFRPMMDQYLRYFLQGIRAKYLEKKTLK